MLKLKRFLKGYTHFLILGPFFKLLEAVFELLVPLIMARIIDNGIAAGNKEYVIHHIILIVILGICGLIFALTCQFFAAKCAFGFGTQLRKSLYRHINSFSAAQLDKFGTDSLITRLTNDTVMVQTGVNMFIRLAVRAPFLIIGATVMAMATDLKLSLVFLIACLLVAFILYKVMTRSIPLYKKNQENLDRLSLLTRENLEGARVIKAFSRQEDEIDEFNKAAGNLCENAIIAGKLGAVLNPVTFMIINLGIVAIIWFGGIRVDTGFLTQGEVTAFINYMTQILLALVVLANLIITFTKAFASANRINEVFDTVSTINDGKINADTSAESMIKFEGVYFRYEGAGADSLKNISFEICKNQTLGIIGGTGSGKSTLISLISRNYDATSGNISLFGRDIKDYSLKSIRENIGEVPQKAVLFSGSILDNMRMAKQDASEEEVIEALKIAQAWEFVEKLPDNIHTQISQGGKNLSGGQKQRLTIARAIVCKPAILILDDSMSALDYTTDFALRKALSEKMKDTCIIMVSQRSTSIKNADKIIVLDDGVQVGTGTHSNLIETCDVYREICSVQNKEV